jgi:hypothetical protein
MNNEYLAAAVVASVAIAGAACTRPAPPWPISPTSVAAPAGTNSSEPQLTVSDSGVILSWIEQSGRSTSTLKFAERTSSGWTAPKTVASGDQWFLSYADPPHVFRRPDGTLLANWIVATDPILEGSDLNLSYSKDNGTTWAPAVLPHHDSSMGQHEFPAFFELPGNGLGVVWLDGRAVADYPNTPDQAPMSLRYAAFDAAWKQVADTTVDARTCDCCSTTAVVTADGVLTAYRDRSDKEIRDIAVSRLENGTWTPPAIVHDDHFEIFECPVNGPMLSARGREVVLAWFTIKDGEGVAWAAFSHDSGRTWGVPVRIDDRSSLGRVDVELLDDGSALATWVELVDKRGEFRVRRIEPSGTRSEHVTISPVSGGVSSGFPRLARQGKDLVFAWTETMGDEEGTATYHVRTATARLP